MKPLSPGRCSADTRGREAETRETQDGALRAKWDMEGEGQQASRMVSLAGGQDLSLSRLVRGTLRPLGFLLCSWANPSLYMSVPSTLRAVSFLFFSLCNFPSSLNDLSQPHKFK